MSDLRLAVDDRTLAAEWTDDALRTQAALEAALPLEGEAARWGDELYFDVPVDVEGEHTRTEVDVGSIAYWPTGNALCLFWGPTPASREDEPRAASPVTVIGRFAEPSRLADLEGGAWVRLERRR